MATNKAERTDHDLLMALATDMKWIKFICTGYLIPMLFLVAKELLSRPSG